MAIMYDENEAIKYIKAALKQTGVSSYSDDDILNIIDIIWDYYEQNGLLDFDNDDELDYDHLLDSVKRMLKKDRGNKVKEEDVETIVKAELDYEDILDGNEDEEVAE